MQKQMVQKQSVRAIQYSLMAVLTFLVLSSTALAQLSSPISPWMGMFDRNRGPGTISNYHQNVKPQQDLLKAYTAQQNQMQSQQQALQALQSGGSGGGAGPRNLTGPGGAPVGAGGVLSPPREIPSMQRNPAGFNQYSHYYPQSSMPRRPVPNFSTTGRRR